MIGIKVKVILRGQDVPESNCKCFDFYPEAGGGPSIECILVNLQKHKDTCMSKATLNEKKNLHLEIC